MEGARAGHGGEEVARAQWRGPWPLVGSHAGTGGACGPGRRSQRRRRVREERGEDDVSIFFRGKNTNRGIEPWAISVGVGAGGGGRKRRRLTQAMEDRHTKHESSDFDE